MVLRFVKGKKNLVEEFSLCLQISDARSEKNVIYLFDSIYKISFTDQHIFIYLLHGYSST